MFEISLCFRIVETMSYTENVANFMLMPNIEETNVNMSDLELIAGDIIEKVRSRSNSPTGTLLYNLCS